MYLAFRWSLHFSSEIARSLVTFFSISSSSIKVFWKSPHLPSLHKYQMTNSLYPTFLKFARDDTWSSDNTARWNSRVGLKDMSLNSNEVDSPVALTIDSEAFRIKFINDENSPISSGEIRTMRNHPKVTSGIFSPSRKSRGDSKIKPKSFSSGLYSSPSAKTVRLLCSFSSNVVLLFEQRVGFVSNCSFI